MEGYVPDLGFPLLSGGRYDKLHEQFGQATPAVGFALGLERLMEVLRIQGRGIEPLVGGLLVCGDDPKDVIATAQAYRAQGTRVMTDLDGMDGQEAQRFAAVHGLDKILRMTRGSEQWVNVETEGGGQQC